VAASKAISVTGMRFTQKNIFDGFIPLPFFINYGACDSATLIICGRQI